MNTLVDFLTIITHPPVRPIMYLKMHITWRWLQALTALFIQAAHGEQIHYVSYCYIDEPHDAKDIFDLT